MKTKPLHWLAMSALTTLWLGIPSSAQSVPGQTTPVRDDNDTTRNELAQFDRFLDSHREIAEQLRKDPSLVNDKTFVKNHPVLQTYLQEHPGVREEIKEDPNAFMHKEARYDRQENMGRAKYDNDTTRAEITKFDVFLDNHREIAEQIRKNPSLVNDKEFEKNHPALQTYLQDNPNAREELKEDPNNFMRREDRYEYGAAAAFNHDSSRARLTQFDQFLDSHREIAQQLHKDPSLADNEQYLKDHPELRSYLRDHPDIRAGLRQNPDAYMHRENNYDRAESATNPNSDRDRDTSHDLDRNRDINRSDRDQDANSSDRDRADRDGDANRNRDATHVADRDVTRDHDYDRMDHDRDSRYSMDREASHKSFGEFLGSHSSVAQQLSKNPSLVRNQEYLENHPELKSYLNEHPDVRQHLMENPQTFIKSAQQYNHATGTTTQPTSTDPKMKH